MLGVVELLITLRFTASGTLALTLLVSLVGVTISVMFLRFFLGIFLVVLAFLVVFIFLCLSIVRVARFATGLLVLLLAFLGLLGRSLMLPQVPRVTLVDRVVGLIDAVLTARLGVVVLFLLGLLMMVSVVVAVFRARLLVDLRFAGALGLLLVESLIFLAVGMRVGIALVLLLKIGT